MAAAAANLPKRGWDVAHATGEIVRSDCARGAWFLEGTSSRRLVAGSAAM